MLPRDWSLARPAAALNLVAQAVETPRAHLYHVRVLCDAPRCLAAAVVALPSVDAVHGDPDGAVVVLSRNMLDLQIEFPPRDVGRHQPSTRRAAG